MQVIASVLLIYDPRTWRKQIRNISIIIMCIYTVYINKILLVFTRGVCARWSIYIYSALTCNTNEHCEAKADQEHHKDQDKVSFRQRVKAHGGQPAWTGHSMLDILTRQERRYETPAKALRKYRVCRCNDSRYRSVHRVVHVPS